MFLFYFIYNRNSLELVHLTDFLSFMFKFTFQHQMNRLRLLQPRLHQMF